MTMRWISLYLLLMCLVACGSDGAPVASAHDLSGDWKVFIYPPPGSTRDADTSYWRLIQNAAIVSGQRCTYGAGYTCEGGPCRNTILVCTAADRTGMVSGSHFDLQWEYIDPTTGTTQTTVCSGNLSADDTTFSGNLLSDGVTVQVSGERLSRAGL